MITADTWAVVFATAVGPTAAIGISLWREAVKQKHDRRLEVFRTLMATRRVGLSPAHVNSLNLIEVDFYRCSNVEVAWRAYKDHLYSGGPEDEVWQEIKERLLAKLLSEMGKVLRFKIDTLDIFKGGYAPKGWDHRDLRQLEAAEYLHNLTIGQGSLPIFITGANMPQPQEQPKKIESE
jgi:hypothetical protein